MTLLLASGSPRRRELLTRACIPHRVEPSGVEERPPAPEEDPAEYALELAKQKARVVARRWPGQAVLAADTVVAVDGQILGKPRDEADAIRMLTLLNGRSHLVVTGVALRCGPRLLWGTRAATVTMRRTVPQEIAAYVRTGEPSDKAGAYAIQGEGGRLVEAVEGCYHAVVGLPLCLTAELLRQCDLLAPDATISCCQNTE